MKLSYIFKNNPIINEKSDLLKWCSIYGLSSFSYGILGILIFICFKNNFKTEKHGIPIPIYLYISGLIIQSIVTFMADVYFINSESICHNIDRFVALINTLSFSICFFWMSFFGKIILIFGLTNGLYLFKLSRYYRKRSNLKLYTYYHSLWHIILPAYIFIWLIFRDIMWVKNT